MNEKKERFIAIVATRIVYSKAIWHYEWELVDLKWAIKIQLNILLGTNFYLFSFVRKTFQKIIDV